MVERLHARSVWLVYAVASMFVGIGCSLHDESGLKEISLREARHIIVEIDAMVGATPSFAALKMGVSPWLVLERNLEAIAPPSFAGLSTPHSEEEVGPLDAAAGGVFSDDDIRGLAERHRDLGGDELDAHFHILFLNGEYAGNTERARARAVNIGDTRIIAVFGAAAADDSDFERMAEQSALVHELGHAFGLINLGIRDISHHSDPSSPQHCSEKDCVMGTYSTVSNAATRFLQGGEVPVLFGSKCLEDVANYYE